jgi:hypothetical protein
MKIPKMPGFTAEASFYSSRNVDFRYSINLASSSGQFVIPQARFSCARNSSGFCEVLRDWIGGGLSTNPDGTVSCDYS